MDYSNFYLKEEDVFGTSVETLLHATQVIDENTTVVKLDYADCSIMTYNQQKGGVLFLNKSEIGKQLKKVRLAHSHIPDPLAYMVPEAIPLALSDLSRHKALCLVKEMIDNPTEHGTAFYFGEGTPKESLVFVSPIAAKTMGQRLPLPTKDSSMERNLYIAKAIDDMNTSIPLYSVLRSTGSGPYKKLIAVFAKNPKRLDLNQSVSLLQEFGCNNIYWKFSQRSGLYALFDCPLLHTKIHISELQHYETFVGIQICDSGHMSNKVFVGLYDPNNPAQSHFVMAEENIPDFDGDDKETISNAFRSFLTKTFTQFMVKRSKCLDLIESWHKQKVNSVSLENFISASKDYLSSLKVTSVKAKNNFAKYCSGNYSRMGKGVSQYTFFFLLISALAGGYITTPIGEQNELDTIKKDKNVEIQIRTRSILSLF